MGWLRLIDWPTLEESWDPEDELTWWDRARGWVDMTYDGSWPARALWDLKHPPVWIDWIPPWRRHRKPCDERFRQASMDLMAGGTAEDFQRHTGGISYCPSCDYWHLTKRHPVYWLVLTFGEH